VTPKLTNRTSLDPEEILVSRSRIKILGALAMKGPLNISGIKKYTGLNHKSITKALQVLKYAKVVVEVDLNRTRSFRIRVENEKACAIDRLIKSLDKQERIPKENEGNGLISSNAGSDAAHNKI
jgi:predicted transcriptional regulator